nr:MAG TPA: hypothetical protein [Caudoviricetes sp.]
MVHKEPTCERQFSVNRGVNKNTKRQQTLAN